MTRANCVRAENGTAQEKAPTAATVEALDNSERCRLTKTDGDFVTSFRRIAQARDIVIEVIELWKEVDQKRPPEQFEEWEKKFTRRIIAEALEFARECYRGDIVSEFEAIFGVAYNEFWAALEELQAKFDGA